MNFNKISIISGHFFNNSSVIKIEKLLIGNINKTYIVEHIFDGIKSKFVLQCLSNIFDSHDILNSNHKLITEHMTNKLQTNYLAISKSRWEVPCLIECNSNNLFTFSFESNFWRAIKYIDQTLSLNYIEDNNMAYQIGLGLAKFHLMLEDFDSSRIKKTIKNFHDTNYYIDQYLISLNDFDFSKLENELVERVKLLNNTLSCHIEYVQSLLASINTGFFDKQVIHGDPKLSNFLIDFKEGFVVSLIDLDTVSSGYLLTDLADCIRSICNVSGEDPEDIDSVFFDNNYCMYFLKGYLSITDESKFHSFSLLPEFIYVITFELSIRFITDFLRSNTYFKVEYDTQNLFRAEVQLQLLISFISKSPDLLRDFDELGILSNSTFASDVQKLI